MKMKTRMRMMHETTIYFLLYSPTKQELEFKKLLKAIKKTTKIKIDFIS